jgi:hypothetical protein
MESRAKLFFNEITVQDNPFKYLLSLPESPEPRMENEWFDCKGAEQISGDDAIKLFRKAVSGFANVGGGVLILGLDARKTKEDPVDRIRGVSLHPEAQKLASRLNSLINETTSPPLFGIEMKVYNEPDSTKGFIVFFIPEGEDKPYRAESDGKYYIRIGESFEQAPVPLLRSLFHPRASSRITPLLIMQRGTIAIKVNNVGTLSAESLLLRLDTHWLDHTQYRLHVNHEAFKFHGNFSIPSFHNAYTFHPGQSDILCQLVVDSLPPNSGPIMLDIDIYSKDALAYKWQFRIGEIDLGNMNTKIESYERIPIH